MVAANLSTRDHQTILDGIERMRHAPCLAATTRALVDTALQLAPSDHGGYTEIDPYFGRIDFVSTEPTVEEWVQRRAQDWRHFMPTHPVFRYRLQNPSARVVRLSDLISQTDFRRTGLYQELFRDVGTEHQIVLHLGIDPRVRLPTGVLPSSLGVPLNRAGYDFRDHEVVALTLLQQMALPVIQLKRLKHQVALLESAVLDEGLKRSLMRLGLSERQAEVVFWIVKGKNNGEIASILDIGTQTVRQHTMAIYRRLGLVGRMSLQLHILRSIIGPAD